MQRRPSLRSFYEALSTPLLEHRLKALEEKPEAVGPYPAAAVVQLIKVVLANRRGYYHES